MPISADTQARLFHEADARFAAQSGITRKLDPRNKLDQAQIPVWTDIYNRVRREYEAGIIAWTFDNPFVQKSLEAASILADKSAGHFDQALTAAGSGLAAGAMLAEAEIARAASQLAALHAASAQPPTIDPALAAAAAEVSRAHGSVASPADAVAAAQANAAPGHAVGVHTPGDPNALHFTMQGGQQGAGGAPGGGGAAGAAAQKRPLWQGLAIAAGAIGVGALAFAAIPKAKPRGGSRNQRTLVIRRDRVYGSSGGRS